MKVEVRLFAYFREGREKKYLMELPESATLSHIIDRLNISFEEIGILLINGRDGHARQYLAENDIIALFPPVGGG